MVTIKNNVIFLGPPGSGKGTISSLMESTWDIKQISTGDIFREEIANKSTIGIQVKQLVESGQYVPDNITNEIVKNKVIQLDKENRKFILDGYPRTLSQAQFLDKLNLSTKFIVINLEISDQVITNRLSQRWFCPTCKTTYNETSLRSKKHPYCEKDDTMLIHREDDKPESIKKRLQVYKEQTFVLIEYYKNQGNLISINSDNSVENILKEIEQKIHELKNNQHKIG